MHPFVTPSSPRTGSPRFAPAPLHGARWLLVEPRFEVPPALQAARIERAALEHLYDVFTLYTAETLAKGRSDVRGYAKVLRDSGTVVSLDPPAGKARVYPSFQFDEDVEVRPVVAEVNQLLGARTEPHAAASWWATPNARLDGRAPFELCGADSQVERLVDAAKATLTIDS